MKSNQVTIPRGQISILAGASGAGKTTLMMQAIAASSKGVSFIPEFTWLCDKGIAYVAADRTITETLELIKKIDYNPEKVQFYGLVDDTTIPNHLLATPRSLFNAIVAKFTKPFDVLILDPLGLFMEGSMNNYNHVAKSLIPMNQWALKEGVTLIATHHSRKARSDFKFQRPQDRISGSTALLGYSGTQMVLVPKNEEENQEWDQLHVIPHTMEDMTVYLQRGQDGLLYPIEVGVPVTKPIIGKFTKPFGLKK